MSLFKSIWVKLSASLAVLVAFLIARTKWQSHKIDNLEEEVEMNNKESMINDEMRQAIEDAEKQEAKDIADINDADWKDNI